MVVQEERAPVTTPVRDTISTPPRVVESGRTKATINLKDAFNGTAKAEEKKPEEKVDVTADVPVAFEKLTAAWQEFAERRKNQIAEYNLLKKEFTLSGTIVTVALANPIEEPLLQNIRVQLTAHLRDRLNNNSISIVSMMQETEGKKIAYTDKEKFDLLAGRNPVLRELKDRFGLDSDF